MTFAGWLQIVVLVVLLTALTPLLGGYMARVYQGEHVALSAIFAPVEGFAYRLFRVDRAEEQGWQVYARSLLIFSAASWLMLYLVLCTQGLPLLNPQRFTHSGPWDLTGQPSCGSRRRTASGTSAPTSRGCRSSVPRRSATAPTS